MEIDSAFLDPLKEFHPILRAVEMDTADLEALLPIRINLFSLVRSPYTERFGFPIDLPQCSGPQLAKLHLRLTNSICKKGADDALVEFEEFLETPYSMYNEIQPILTGGKSRWCLRYGRRRDSPVVVYDDSLHPLKLVETHINMLAVFCNAVHHDPVKFRSSELDRMLLANPQYRIDNMGNLVASGKLHGRWDYESARDLFFTCIVNYVRL